MDEPINYGEQLARQITSEMVAGFDAEHSTPCDITIEVRPWEPMDSYAYVRGFDVN